MEYRKSRGCTMDFIQSEYCHTSVVIEIKTKNITILITISMIPKPIFTIRREKITLQYRHVRRYHIYA